jgi:hypothetical protein
VTATSSAWYKQYERYSSHLVFNGPGSMQPVQYGIDIHPVSVAVPPHDHVHVTFSHLLFCSLDIKGRNFIFLKPEQCGTKGASNFILHGFSYLNYTIMGRFDNRLTQRKERVPANYVRTFFEFLSLLPVPKKDFADSANIGVHAMCVALEVAARGSKLLSDRFRQYVANDLGLESHVEEFSFAFRIGREVFVRQEVALAAMHASSMELLAHPSQYTLSSAASRVVSVSHEGKARINHGATDSGRERYTVSKGAGDSFGSPTRDDNAYRRRINPAASSHSNSNTDSPISGVSPGYASPTWSVTGVPQRGTSSLGPLSLPRG